LGFKLVNSLPSSEDRVNHFHESCRWHLGDSQDVEGRSYRTP
jgi:hypothetical protein